MYVFLQQKTDGSPNNIQKTWTEGGEREGNASGHLQKKNTSITFGPGLCKDIDFANDVFLTTFDIKENNLTLTEGSPHEFSNLRQSLY